jgi:hypothetical protein
MRRLFAIDGLSRLLLAMAAFAAVTFLADWALDLPAAVRLVILGGGLGLGGWILFTRVVKPLGVRITDDDLALFVEREYPDLNDRLISAIQLAREPEKLAASDRPSMGNSPELVEALVADAEQATSAIDFQRVIVRGHVGKVALWAVLVGALLGGAAGGFPELSSIYLSRLLGGGARWPQRTHLKVLDFVDGRRVVARGDDLAIAVEYAGLKPSKVVLDYQFDSGERGQERMTPLAGDRFQATFTRVTGPFRFTVSGGDDRNNGPYTVDTVTPPSLDAVRIFYEYPPYMRKTNTPADRPEVSGIVVAPFFTKVRFEAESNEDLKSASFTLGVKGKEKVTEIVVGKTADGKPRRLTGTFEVTEPTSEYALQLQAQNGLPNRDPIRFPIKGIEDRPPDIIPHDPQADEFVTELCERPIEFEVRDDYGIARIVLEVRILSQQPGKSKDWTGLEFTREQNSRDYGETTILSQTSLDIGKMQLQAGDHVEMKYLAEDYKDIGGRNIRRSKVFKLSIVTMGTLEKELQDAIEKIKALLKTQKNREETAWNRTGRLIVNFGRLDLLTLEQQGEVRQAGLEQNDITSKLDGARKDIRQIQRRGVYNKIYNEGAAQKLQGAIDELDLLVGNLSDQTAREGTSRIAAAGLDQAAKLKSGAERTRALRDAQELQNRSAAGIQRALDFLDKWSSYQEVIRITREIRGKQLEVNKSIQEGGGAKLCPHGRVKGSCPDCDKK